MKKDTAKSEEKAAKQAAKLATGREPRSAPGARDPDELLPEYDPDLIRRGVRGQYAARYAEGTNVVVLDPDVAAAFPDSVAVNSALRALLEVARRQVKGQAPAA